MKDRLSLIKEIYQKRKYILLHPRPKMSHEERLERRRENQRARVQKFKDDGMCIKCGLEPIYINHVHEGIVILSKKTVFCPKHTKGLNAVSIPVKSV